MTPSTRAVRRRLATRQQSRRAPEERFAIRFPNLYRRVSQRVMRLPPHSRVRGLMLWRAARQGYQASNRRDYASILTRYAPDVEFVSARELAALGMAERYHGHDGFVQMWEDFGIAWAADAQWVPEELIDFGDRLLMLGRVSVITGTSEVQVEARVANLMTLRDGLVVREQHFADPDEALDLLGGVPAAPGRSARGRRRRSRRTVHKARLRLLDRAASKAEDQSG